MFAVSCLQRLCTTNEHVAAIDSGQVGLPHCLVEAIHILDTAVDQDRDIVPRVLRCAAEIGSEGIVDMAGGV